MLRRSLPPLVLLAMAAAPVRAEPAFVVSILEPRTDGVLVERAEFRCGAGAARCEGTATLASGAPFRIALEFARDRSAQVTARPVVAKAATGEPWANAGIALDRDGFGGITLSLRNPDCAWARRPDDADALIPLLLCRNEALGLLRVAIRFDGG
jgi:hypothetical protein